MARAIENGREALKLRCVAVGVPRLRSRRIRAASGQSLHHQQLLFGPHLAKRENKRINITALFKNIHDLQLLPPSSHPVYQIFSGVVENYSITDTF